MKIISNQQNMYGFRNKNVLLLHCNGTDGSTTFTDSATGKTVTPHGTMQIDTAQSKFGGASALFDGDSDYLTLADSDDWNFGTYDWTLEGFIRPNGSVGTSFLFSQYIDANNRLDFSLNATYFVFMASKSSTVYAYYLGDSTAITANNLHHFAFVRFGSNFYIYLNGKQVALTVITAISTNAMPDLAQTASIGVRADINYFFNGWLDEYRITKGVARYLKNFTVPNREF
ncbi:MAG TPA: LamG domain-containing protein [Candidatus Lokiarchaeia archaeon]